MDKTQREKKWEFMEMETMELKSMEMETIELKSMDEPFKNNPKNMWGIKSYWEAKIINIDWFDTKEEAQEFYGRHKR